ncbi:hypothetical protein DEU56DRAFT_901848 [Suillus clintonianus]|uniref:uncharacterized protein n=1 Tax=Suillus clintonianus TaxID=1904413 RepID=UPI001B865383|nr:uncharacterized protein DEU56DRAFT_901848 [Suillus clintonianus]KAG2135337.1 hypothetical protein DEU56DRAFT_901848 [Suillus clintonianus]
MGARCGPAKQHMFIESLIACMDGNMPNNLRHAALRAVHSVRQEMVSIDGIDDASLRDMVLKKLSPAILTAICPRRGATPADAGPALIFDDRRDACYVELHGFHLAGILLRIAPEQWSPTSLESITEKQWWYMMSSAWRYACPVIDDIHCFELLPVLVEGTKKYMRVALTFELQQLIRDVDYTLETLESRDTEQGERGEGVAVAVKELRTVASDMLERMVKSDEVVGR